MIAAYVSILILAILRAILWIAVTAFWGIGLIRYGMRADHALIGLTLSYAILIVYGRLGRQLAEP